VRHRGPTNRRVEVTLPWGLTLVIDSQDTIGIALWQLGIYDLALSECAWRLLEPGETALDVGGNIGYMSCLLAARSGPSGCVHTFEPHPLLKKRLEAQIARWPTSIAASVVTHGLALSDRIGTAFLAEPSEFSSNCGTATLQPNDSERGHTVATITLDSLPVADSPVGLMKVDVEGHELSVFQGGAKTLRSGRIRDLVFEEHSGKSSPACTFLQDCGYTLFQIERRFVGPILAEPGSPCSTPWNASNYLATRDPIRALQKMSPFGWQVLKSR